MELLITSTQNPRVKTACDLRERKERDKSSLFLIEGYRELLRAVDAGWKIQELFICPELFLGSNEQQLIERIGVQKAKIYSCNSKVFHKLSYRDRPDGLLAIAEQRKIDLSFLNNLKANPFFVIAEAIEKPGNLGTILRSCDAVGVDALIVSDRCTDIYNPNVVRASVGTLFTVPVIEAQGETILKWLKEHHISIIAATPSGTQNYTETNLKGPIAIAFGTEQLGLSEKWLNQSDIQVRIPMCGVADSLNVATATTVLLYEVLRQRRDSICVCVGENS